MEIVVKSINCQKCSKDLVEETDGFKDGNEFVWLVCPNYDDEDGHTLYLYSKVFKTLS